MRDDAGVGPQDLQEGLQEVPSPALAGPRAVRSPLLLAVCPPHSPRPSPDGRVGTPQVPGKGALGRRTGQLRGDSPPRCQPRRGQVREGRGRGPPACPPATGLSWAPGSPALRPPVPKLLNLRTAHALRGRRPTRRIGPLGWLGSALALRNARLCGSLPALRPVLMPPSRLRSAGAPSPKRGQSSASTREGIPPPRAVPPPSRPPFPGSTAKNGLERQARESVAPSRTHLPAAGELRLERRAGNRKRALDPGADPLRLLPAPPGPLCPASRGFYAARAGAAAAGILGSE